MHVSGCSQHLTAASGVVEPMSVPDNYMTYEQCKIYITGTPGKNVQLMFMKFIMPGNKDNCADREGIVVSTVYINSHVTIELSHPYHLDEPTFIFKDIKDSFSFLFRLSSKQ